MSGLPRGTRKPDSAHAQSAGGAGSRRRVGSIPRKGLISEQWIGFTTDEIERVSDAGFPPLRDTPIPPA